MKKLFLSITGLAEDINEGRIEEKDLDESLFFFEKSPTEKFTASNFKLKFKFRDHLPTIPLDTSRRETIEAAIAKAYCEKRYLTHKPKKFGQLFKRLKTFLKDNGVTIIKKPNYKVLLKGWIVPDLKNIIKEASLDIEVIF